jgi:hypothetical protein
MKSFLFNGQPNFLPSVPASVSPGGSALDLDSTRAFLLGERDMSKSEKRNNVIDLPVKDHRFRAFELLASLPPEDFQGTVAAVLTELYEKIAALQSQVFILSTLVHGERLTPELRQELAEVLDVDLNSLKKETMRQYPAGAVDGVFPPNDNTIFYTDKEPAEEGDLVLAFARGVKPCLGRLVKIAPDQVSLMSLVPPHQVIAIEESTRLERVIVRAYR